MTFKMIKPFVIELITFILVVSVICVALLAGNFGDRGTVLLSPYLPSGNILKTGDGSLS